MEARPGVAGPFGLSLAIIPHWNNSDGGADVDTSHCFIGESRYGRLRADLPAGTNILGIDEHTSLIINLSDSTCQVIGRDEVHIYCDGGECSYRQGEIFKISTLGNYRPLADPAVGISPAAWSAVKAAEGKRADETTAARMIPAEVAALAHQRQQARLQRDWAEADRLRGQIAALGWNVKDTPEGPSIEPNS